MDERSQISCNGEDIPRTVYKAKDDMVGRMKGQAEEEKATKCANCEGPEAFYTLSHLSLTNQGVL